MEGTGIVGLVLSIAVIALVIRYMRRHPISRDD